MAKATKDSLVDINSLIEQPSKDGLVDINSLIEEPIKKKDGGKELSSVKEPKADLSLLGTEKPIKPVSESTRQVQTPQAQKLAEELPVIEKKTETAIKNTVERRLKSKGITFKEGDANYNKEKEDVKKEIKEGSLVRTTNRKGEDDLARGTGFWESAVNSFKQSFTSEADAAKINTIFNAKELSDYLEDLQKKEPDVRDRAKGVLGWLGEQIGGLPKMAGSFAIGEAVNPAFGGATALGVDGEWLGMAAKRQELYYKKRDELLSEKVPEQQAKEQAAHEAIINAPLDALPEAALNFALGKIGGKASPELSASRKIFKDFVTKPLQVGAIGAAKPLAEYGIEKAQGYDTKFMNALKKSGEGFTDFALMDLGFHILLHPKDVSKTTISVAKEYLSNIEPQELQSVLKKYGESSSDILNQLDNYRKAKAKVADYTPQDIMHHVAGLQEAIDNKTATLEKLQSDKTTPEAIIKSEEQQVNELKKRQNEMLVTGNGQEYEIDDFTGNPLIEKQVKKEPIPEEKKTLTTEQLVPTIEVNGKQYSGKNHGEAMDKAIAAGEDIPNWKTKEGEKWREQNGGFIDNTEKGNGEFITRNEASERHGITRSEDLINKDERKQKQEITKEPTESIEQKPTEEEGRTITEPIKVSEEKEKLKSSQLVGEEKKGSDISGMKYKELTDKIPVSQVIDNRNIHEVMTTKEIADILGMSTNDAYKYLMSLGEDKAMRYGYRVKGGWQDIESGGNPKAQSVGWQLYSEKTKPIEQPTKVSEETKTEQPIKEKLTFNKDGESQLIEVPNVPKEYAQIRIKKGKEGYYGTVELNYGSEFMGEPAKIKQTANIDVGERGESKYFETPEQALEYSIDKVKNKYETLKEPQTKPIEQPTVSETEVKPETEAKEEVKPPKPPISQEKLESLSPKEQWTAVRKEKLKEIEGAKELFEKETGKTWDSIQQDAMKNLQTAYPDKNLFDAAAARVSEFVTKYDNNIPFNPTAEDISVIRFFKREVERKISEIEDWNSDDILKRQNAINQFKSYQQDLLNTIKALNPKEAGTAFGIRQSEESYDPEFGLKIRRMELIDSKGEPLTEKELDETYDNWQKEKEILIKEQEVREKALIDKYEKQIEELKKPTKLKEEKIATRKEKILTQKGKEIADKIRQLKSQKGTLQADITLGLKDVAIEAIAQLVEKGAALADAINEVLQDAKYSKLNKNELINDLVGGINKLDNRNELLQNIKGLAKQSNSDTITNEMVSKNLIRDYINSFVDEYSPNEILKIVENDLKEIIPNIDKNKLLNAYLKDGDYKIQNKKFIESELKKKERDLTKLIQLQKDINDLKEKNNLYKKNNPTKTDSPFSSEIKKKENELKRSLVEKGLKISNEDKYTKASYESRANSHNARIEGIISDIDNKLLKEGISDVEKDKLTELKTKLESAKIVLDPNSKLSQKDVLKVGLSTLESIKRTLSPINEFRRKLDKVASAFESDKQKSEQDIKLQRIKKKFESDINEYKRKIQAGEYEDNPTIKLSKYDAELVKLEKQRTNIKQIFESKKREFEKQNKSKYKRFAESLRAAYVVKLISSPVTYLKVGVSALLRPNAEAATKLSFGKLFDVLAPELAEQAKKGGESSSIASVKASYEAVFKQYGEEKLEKLFTEANQNYEKAYKEYSDYKKEYDTIKNPTKKDTKKLNDLDNNRKQALINAVGRSIYQYIAGSSVKEAMQVLLHRSATIEREFGQFDTEEWQSLKNNPEKLQTTIDNINYVLNFVGRSHAALKNFSSRASFAAGFIARLEGSVNEGIDISKPDKILEIANESYLDWDRGKYQQSNYISDTWNKITSNVEKASPIAAYVMKSDVAVTRVPVNILHEAIMEYSLGAITSAINMGREYYKARNIVLKDEYTPKDGEIFKQQLKKELSNIDPDKAATIARAFRKGGFGLGMYALASLGVIGFGGFAHKGQTAEDKKMKKIEEETGVKQMMTGEITVGGKPVPESIAKALEHASFLYPLFLPLGLNRVYENNIKQGKSEFSSVSDAAYQHLNIIINSIPQISKFIMPLAQPVIQSLTPKSIGQWDDVDSNGQPMKREYFDIRDFGNALPLVGDKKELLSDFYFKQAKQTINFYQKQRAAIVNDGNLSEKEKTKQIEELEKEKNDLINEIYKQNKENPQ